MKQRHSEGQRWDEQQKTKIGEGKENTMKRKRSGEREEREEKKREEREREEREREERRGRRGPLQNAKGRKRKKWAQILRRVRILE